MASETTHAVDPLIEHWPALSHSERLERFLSLPRTEADDLFLGVNARDQAELVLSLPEGERRVWMRLLAPDDAADVVQASPAQHRAALLDMLDAATRNEVNALLAY